MAANDSIDGHRTDNSVVSPTEFHSLGEPPLNPLVLLLRVETLDGSSLPEKFLTVSNCHDLSIECGEEEPYKVELLSTYEACLTYKEDVVIVELAIKLMAVETWIALPVVITAVIPSKDTVDKIIQVWEQSRKDKEMKANDRLAAMQEEQDAPRYRLKQATNKETQLMEDITSYVAKQGDLTKIVRHLTEQVKILESQQSLNQIKDERRGRHFRSPLKENPFSDVEVPQTSSTNFQIKADLDLGKFSGSDPTHPEELTFEQWCTDVKAYQIDYPAVVLLPAVRKSIIGKAKSVVRSFGPRYTIDDAIRVLTKEYAGVASSDVIFKEFYQLKQ